MADDGILSVTLLINVSNKCKIVGSICSEEETSFVPFTMLISSPKILKKIKCTLDLF